MVVLVFVASAKGGAGRSVTSANVAYRSALRGLDVCYLDFDFAAPTAGILFQVASTATGTAQAGLHAFLDGRSASPVRIDVCSQSDRSSLRHRPPSAGRLVMMPGDRNDGDFPVSAEVVKRCADLFLRLEEEFDLTIVDLRGGLSHAVELALAATAAPMLQAVTSRWLVLHRWTRQDIIASSEFVYADNGIITAGGRLGHDQGELASSLRFVRTMVQDPSSYEFEHLVPEQIAFWRDVNLELLELAAVLRLGRTLVLGEIPFESILAIREQVVTDDDVHERRIATTGIVEAYERLAGNLLDNAAWEPW